jgi:hypothetical protein
MERFALSLRLDPYLIEPFQGMPRISEAATMPVVVSAAL